MIADIYFYMGLQENISDASPTVQRYRPRAAIFTIYFTFPYRYKVK